MTDLGTVATVSGSNKIDASVEKLIRDNILGALPRKATPTETAQGVDDTSYVTPFLLESVRENLPLAKFDVTQYGAVGDGVTDDTAAIQSAINAAGAAGGGTVYFPRGDYFINTFVSAAGSSWGIVVNQSGITLLGEGPEATRLFSTTPNTRPFAILGNTKSGSLATWNTRTCQAATVYPFATGTIPQGATTITLATAAHASNFTPGDVIYLRTGITVSTAVTPDSEINFVQTVDATTGVITLRFPTSKTYAQEYYISGNSGVTSTTVTANAAPFGAANVTDRMIHGVLVANMTFDSGPASQGFSAWQGTGFRFRNVHFESTTGSLFGSQSVRDAWVKDCRFDIKSSTTSALVWFFAPSTGCTDWIVKDNVFTSAGGGFIHLHEGIARLTFADNFVTVARTGAPLNAISVRARAYDHKIKGNTITVDGVAAVGLYVDGLCDGGGIISGNTFRGNALSGNAVRVDARNWKFTSSNAVDDGDVSIYQIPSNFDTEHHTGWVTVALGLTPVLGEIPKYARVTGVYVEVVQAFNSDGTDTLSIGYSGSPAAYAAAVDVSTTGIKPVVLGSGVGYSSVVRNIIATYAAGGSAPTTGKALITVSWQRCPRES